MGRPERHRRGEDGHGGHGLETDAAEDAQLACHQGAAQPGDAGADGEREQLGRRHAVAQGRGGALAVPDRGPAGSGGALRQHAQGHADQCEDSGREQEVARFRSGEGRSGHGDALGRAGEALVEHDHGHRTAEGEGRHRQVHAAQPQRRQSDRHAHRHGRTGRQHHQNEEGQTGVDVQPAGRPRPDARERERAECDHARAPVDDTHAQRDQGVQCRAGGQVDPVPGQCARGAHHDERRHGP